MRLTVAAYVAAGLLIAAAEAGCQNWLVTEVEAELPLYSTSPPFHLRKGRDIDSHLALTYGALKNVSPIHAVGITGSLMTTGAKSGSRAEIRYRNRGNPLAIFQGSAGVEKWGIHGASNTTENARGLTASAGVERSGIGLEARLHLLRTGDRAVGAFSLGARAGGKPGKTIMILAAVAGALFIFSAMTGYGWSEAT